MKRAVIFLVIVLLVVAMLPLQTAQAVTGFHFEITGLIGTSGCSLGDGAIYKIDLKWMNASTYTYEGKLFADGELLAHVVGGGMAPPVLNYVDYAWAIAPLPKNLPAKTVMTVKDKWTVDGETQTDEFSYYCDGGFPTGGGVGPDMVPIPATAVVGSFVQTTAIYFEPSANAATNLVMEAGKTAWVYGMDASGGYYKVMLSGQFFWVPVSTMGPNYDEVWNGKPLPTEVVE